MSVYGNCPICGTYIESRERRINGNDRCANGHVFPSKKAVDNSSSYGYYSSNNSHRNSSDDDNDDGDD
jgi:hypothetical protein